MAELQRVPLDHPPSRSWVPSLATLLLVFLALAIVKPWGAATTVPSPEALASATARTSPVPTQRTDRLAYDPRLFGSKEPSPGWELWPAGYVVEFGIAGPLPVTHASDGPPGQPPGSPPPSPGSQPSPTMTAEPSPTSTPDGPRATTVPGAPPLVDLGPSDHLVALGINTPTDVVVDEVRLWLVLDGGDRRVPILHLPTLWESRHFVVIGIEDPRAPGKPGPWAPGEYRLELATVSGQVWQVELWIRDPQA